MMEEFSIDLEKLKVKPGDDVRADRITSIVQAIIENKQAIIENRELTRDILKSLGIDSEKRLRELMK